MKRSHIDEFLADMSISANRTSSYLWNSKQRDGIFRDGFGVTVDMRSCGSGQESVMQGRISDECFSLRRIRAVALSAATLLSGAASAADPSVSTAPRAETRGGGAWVIDAAFYGWASGLEGTVATLPPLPPVDVNFGFNDLLSHLDGALMGSVYARRDRFILFGDLMYAKVSVDKDFATRSSTNVSLSSSSLMVTGGAGYRLADDPTYSVDLLAGARVYNVSTDATLRIGRAFSRAGNANETWVDPMVGAKFNVRLSDRWSLNSWGFVGGGFGAGSTFAWDLFGGVGYDFDETYSLVVGYRGLGVDYSHNGYVYDVVQHGPIVGLKIRF
jgi:hypothetical protein